MFTIATGAQSNDIYETLEICFAYYRAQEQHSTWHQNRFTSHNSLEASETLISILGERELKLDTLFFVSIFYPNSFSHWNHNTLK